MVAERLRRCRGVSIISSPAAFSKNGILAGGTQTTEVIGIDFMGSFSERKVGKKRFILVVIDRLRGLGEARALKNEGSRDIIEVLEHWVRFRGCPRVLCANVAQATRSYELRIGVK